LLSGDGFVLGGQVRELEALKPRHDVLWMFEMGVDFVGRHSVQLGLVAKLLEAVNEDQHVLKKAEIFVDPFFGPLEFTLGICF